MENKNESLLPSAEERRALYERYISDVLINSLLSYKHKILSAAIPKSIVVGEEMIKYVYDEVVQNQIDKIDLEIVEYIEIVYPTIVLVQRP